MLFARGFSPSFFASFEKLADFAANFSRSFERLADFAANFSRSFERLADFDDFEGSQVSRLSFLQKKVVSFPCPLRFCYLRRTI